MKNLFFLLAIMFFSILNLKAQTPSSCVTAMDVCSKDDLSIFFDTSMDQNLDSLPGSCEFITSGPIELDVIWLKYSFISSGDFIFNIIPSQEYFDIDFVVFQSPLNNCENLESIRCMFTGENFGTPTDSSCTGSTGLSFNATDFAEAAGCQIGDDNYLAPLEVEAGDEVYLMISAFSNELHEYRIEHDGTAELSCSTTSIKKEYQEKFIDIFPNPFTNKIHIEFESDNVKTGELMILSSTGELVFSEPLSKSVDLNLIDLPTGIYFINFVTIEGEHIVKKIAKL